MSLQKALSILVLALCLCAAAAQIQQAQAQELRYKIYIEPKAGLSFMTADSIKDTTDAFDRTDVVEQDEYNTLGVFGASAGVKLFADQMFPVRTEIEYLIRTYFNYSANPTYVDTPFPISSDIDMLIQTLLFNAYVDYNNPTAFTPYIGGGIGMAFIHSDAEVRVPGLGSASESNYQTNFAWQIGGGVYYNFTENWVANLGYRYSNFGDMEWGEPSVLGLESEYIYAHEVMLGLRYEF